MRLGTRIASLAAGTRCRACRRPGSAFCEVCRRAAPRPFDTTAPRGADRMLAAWAYEGAPRSFVLDLKARGVRSAAHPLATGLAEQILAQGLRAGCLTWVPGRERENAVRGFDHAEEIARVLAFRLGLPAAKLLTRTGDTVDQAGLSRSERLANLEGAFSARAITGWVALVDDVVTSGATAEACARALRSAGAAGVEVLTACRA